MVDLLVCDSGEEANDRWVFGVDSIEWCGVDVDAGHEPIVLVVGR